MERLPFNNESTIAALLQHGEGLLSKTSSSPRLDAELLMAKALGGTRTSVITRLRDRCAVEVYDSFMSFIQRRQGGEPVAYIIGEREFWGLSFEVSPAVLVPRPESELLIQEGLAVLKGVANPKVVDLGTGSGCLIISLVHELLKRGEVAPSCVGVDCSPDALAVAKRNAERFKVEHCVNFVESDWFSRKERFDPPYDLVIANPPYIDPADKIPVELSFEPSGALFADEQGLAQVRCIFSQSAQLLRSGGVLLCEVGANKRGLLSDRALFDYQQWRIDLLGDDSPSDRFTVIKGTLI